MIPLTSEENKSYCKQRVKELAEEFEGQFECLGENTEKNITFSITINKELEIIKQSHTK